MFDEIKSSSFPMFKRLALVALGLVLSFVATLVLDVVTNMHTPGWYTSRKLLSKGEDTNIGLLGITANGLDWLLFFAVFAGIYLLIVHKNRRSQVH